MEGSQSCRRYHHHVFPPRHSPTPSNGGGSSGVVVTATAVINAFISGDRQKAMPVAVAIVDKKDGKKRDRDLPGEGCHPKFVE